MGDKAFLSGNEAVAEGVRLASPHVIAAYSDYSPDGCGGAVGGNGGGRKA